jgi:hypothetical protein
MLGGSQGGRGGSVTHNGGHPNFEGGSPPLPFTLPAGNDPRLDALLAPFARKFDNLELDRVFDDCLYQAVRDTGYELRTATQRAGLVDAVIEDEIRRCRFLIADLSDSNAGAYWEAGFAEGLGKPVIYICKANCEVHFDTDHRHTVRWDLSDLDQTAKKLKAVIRTLFLATQSRPIKP